MKVMMMEEREAKAFLEQLQQDFEDQLMKTETIKQEAKMYFLLFFLIKLLWV